MSEPSICTFCHNSIVGANTAWECHHPSYASLAGSAHRRCYFCSLLCADVLKHRKELEKFVSIDHLENQTIQYWLPSDHKKARKLPAKRDRPTSLYRWSVRSLGRIRESNYVVAITFRVVPQASHERTEGNSENHLNTFGLPDRVFYCFPESDLGPLPSPINLGRSTNPETNDGAQIKNWIWTCGVEHKHCPKRFGVGGKFVPTRLIQVGGRRPGDRLRVLDTKANKIKGPYVTLSHCWGEGEGFRKDTLRSDSLAEFQNEGVPWNFLSRTFKEAIEVAQFLEIDHIWIDSLCIIQGRDKLAVQDWDREGSLMHKVYRNSFCNIAAADAKDSTQGLFRKREPRDVFSARFQSDQSSNIFGRRVWRAFREDMWEAGLLKRPLYSRGWVFQERMLAPRILHFSQHQIFWDCAAMSACEAVPAGLPPALDRQSSTDRHWRGRLQEGGTNRAILMSSVNDDSPEDFWKMTVENYTKLNLKFQTDKLRAIWGIAKLVRDSLEEDYAAGMWSKQLEEQLAWRVSDCTVADRPQVLTINPSWSWASVNGKILIEGRTEGHLKVHKATNHNDEALSFDAGNRNARPGFTRAPSETLEEDVMAMTRDLELVDERRRRSSASSRKISQTEFTSTRHNSQSVFPTPRNDSLAGFASPRNNSLAGLMLSRNNSLTGLNPSRQNSEETKKSEPSGTIIMETRTMSPQQLPTPEVPETQTPDQLTRQNSEATRRTSEISTISSLKTRDMEPDLADKRIAIQAHIHHGVMQPADDRGSWTINLAGETTWKPEHIVIDAFPDIKRDLQHEAIFFVILTLFQHFQQNEIVYFEDEEEQPPPPKSWFTGSGVMVRPAAEGEKCYVRTGAIHIRHLSIEASIKLRKGEQKEDTVKTQFFLV